jgi:predicted PurR-regulated permease PerM
MLGVIVVYVVLRQVEDQLVMPIVVGRAVELHPLVAMFAVLTGGASAGAFGAVLAIPIAAARRVTLDQLFPEPSERVPDPPPSLPL